MEIHRPLCTYGAATSLRCQACDAYRHLAWIHGWWIG